MQSAEWFMLNEVSTASIWLERPDSTVALSSTSLAALHIGLDYPRHWTVRRPSKIVKVGDLTLLEYHDYLCNGNNLLVLKMWHLVLSP
jgi:hypothetical protein